MIRWLTREVGDRAESEGANNPPPDMEAPQCSCKPSRFPRNLRARAPPEYFQARNTPSGQLNFLSFARKKQNKRFRKMHFSSFLLFWYQKMRVNILIKPIFPNSRFSAVRNLDSTFSHTWPFKLTRTCIRNTVKYNNEWNKCITFGGKLESPTPTSLVILPYSLPNSSVDRGALSLWGSHPLGAPLKPSS